jgi:hypothetical protein
VNEQNFDIRQQLGVEPPCYVRKVDVARAALALNYSRAGLHDVFDLYLLAFTEEELQGVTRQQTDDGLPRQWAAKHHWNFMFTEDNFEVIAEALAQKVRLPKSFSRNKLRDARDTLRAQGCLSVGPPKSSGCDCEKSP